MATIISKAEILKILPQVDVIKAMEEGFTQYSNGNCVVPPVGELIMEHPPGDVHIKYGYIKGDDYYVIKIASGFYENPKLGLASGQGMMLLFNQKTGQPVAILLDEGHLTDIRTAAAGALAVQYFAPSDIKAIGILGTGVQAKLQMMHVQKNNPCKAIWLWGRNPDHAEKIKQEWGEGYQVYIAQSPAEVAQHANVIITTTPTEDPLLKAEDVHEGTTIVAVGSDTKHKQELESNLLKKADLVIADSIPQSKSRGEIYRATKNGVISESDVVELGAAIQDKNHQRKDDQQIIVVDLTGVAVQDIMITSAVYENFIKASKEQ